MQTEILKNGTVDSAVIKNRKRRKKRRAAIIAIVNVVLILGVLIGGYFAFFTPEKRLERSLTKAEEAYKDGDYTQACKQYQEAIKLDRDNAKAMAGLLDSYHEKKDFRSLEESFDEFVSVISADDFMLDDENKQYVVHIYTYADRVYVKDIDKRIALYEAALTKTASDDIRDLLVTDYLKMADEYRTLDNMDSEISFYNKVILLDAENEAAKANRKERIVSSIRTAIDEELYDEADALIEKYKGVADDIDFSAYADESAEKRKIKEAKHELLASVYEYMSKKDYASMMKIDGSAEANMIGKYIGTSFVYTPDGGEVTNYTGVAAAMFIFKEEAYYFYYGDFVNGKCSGNGVMFLLTDVENGSYYLYEGAWEDNKPNGKGKVLAYHEYDPATKNYITREETGNFTDGLQNGKMKGTVVINDTEKYTGSWKTQNGIPKDVSGNYADYPFSIPEGKIMYAVFLNDDGSVGWGSWVSETGHLGVIPFVN